MATHYHLVFDWDTGEIIGLALPRDVGVGAGLPPATDVGQVLFSVDGSTFTVRQPITTEEGWLVNDEGHLLVVGC